MVITNIIEPYSIWFDLYAITYPRRKGLDLITNWLNENDIVYDERFFRIGMLRLSNIEDAMAFKLRWL